MLWSPKLGAGRLKPAWLLVLEKLRQFGVVDRAVAVLVVHVEETIHLRRGCGLGFGFGGRVQGFDLSLDLSKLGASRARVKVGMSAKRARAKEGATKISCANHCATRYAMRARMTRLVDGCGRDQLGDAAVELLPGDLAVTVGVPLVEEVDQCRAMLEEREVPSLHRGDEGPLCLEPLVRLQAEVDEDLLAESEDVEEEGAHREPTEPRARDIARQRGGECHPVLQHDQHRHHAQRHAGGGRGRVDQEAEPRDEDLGRLAQILEWRSAGRDHEVGAWGFGLGLG